MDYPPIKKDPDRLAVPPNLREYEKCRASFSWDSVRSELDGLPGGNGLNLAHEAVDRHADGPLRQKIAIRWLGKGGEVLDLTYGDLREKSNRFANILVSLGVSGSERVFCLSGRIPDLYISALGTVKNRSVFCPLFSAFGPEPICQRMVRGDAQVLVTTERQYLKKVAGLLERLPSLRFVLLTDKEDHRDERVRSLLRLMAEASDDFSIPPTSPDDMAILHFTSGTTGMPKGAVHVHNAILTHYLTGKYVLDLHRDDIFWCTADPGWVTGTSYGIFAPLA
ncbi:MAG TPA: AMP-binding protein, partial [Geobacteraceae bacterium]|nr:AMP-binding protein [Geobacteraceae bacterium]